MLTWIYWTIITLRNKWYDLCLPDASKYCIPIISIGNISTGGTGKTPFVIYICKMLKSMNITPGVLGGGYKRKHKGDVIVSNKGTIFCNVAEAGDEMLLIAKKTKSSVFVGQSKSKFALKINNWSNKSNISDIPTNFDYNIDCIVVDDGFQHRKLHRDIDIVLVDKKTLNTSLLPYGRLREPLCSLNRADIILLTKGATLQNLKYNYVGKQPVFEVHQKFSTPFLLSDNMKLDAATIKQCIALTGIATENTFYDMLKAQEIQLIYNIKKSDHFNYKLNDVVSICKNCLRLNCFVIATTEKDAIKLKFFENIFEQYKINVVVYPIESYITDEENFKASLLKKLKMKKAKLAWNISIG